MTASKSEALVRHARLRLALDLGPGMGLNAVSKVVGDFGQLFVRIQAMADCLSMYADRFESIRKDSTVLDEKLMTSVRPVWTRASFTQYTPPSIPMMLPPRASDSSAWIPEPIRQYGEYPVTKMNYSNALEILMDVGVNVLHVVTVASLVSNLAKRVEINSVKTGEPVREFRRSARQQRRREQVEELESKKDMVVLLRWFARYEDEIRKLKGQVDTLADLDDTVAAMKSAESLMARSGLVMSRLDILDFQATISDDLVEEPR